MRDAGERVQLRWLIDGFIPRTLPPPLGEGIVSRVVAILTLKSPLGRGNRSVRTGRMKSRRFHAEPQRRRENGRCAMRVSESS
jgi:hypothetical protein